MRKIITTALLVIATSTFALAQDKKPTPEEKAKMIVEKATKVYQLTESQKTKIYNLAVDYGKKNDAITKKYQNQNQTDVWAKEESELTKMFSKNCDAVLTPAQKAMNKKK